MILILWNLGSMLVIWNFSHKPAEQSSTCCSTRCSHTEKTFVGSTCTRAEWMLHLRRCAGGGVEMLWNVQLVTWWDCSWPPVWKLHFLMFQCKTVENEFVANLSLFGLKSTSGVKYLTRDLREVKCGPLGVQFSELNLKSGVFFSVYYHFSTNRNQVLVFLWFRSFPLTRSQIQ